MARAAAGDLLDSAHGFADIVKAIAPQSNINLHGILRGEIFLARLFAFQTFDDEAHALCADTLKSTRFIR